MGRCPICHDGALQEQLVETCMRQGNRWVVFRSVPAMVCDLCSERVFSQGIAERLATILEPTSHEIPTGFLWCPEFDLAIIERARAQGERPLVIIGIEQGPEMTLSDWEIPKELITKVTNEQVLIDVCP